MTTAWIYCADLIHITRWNRLRKTLGVPRVRSDEERELELKNQREQFVVVALLLRSNPKGLWICEPRTRVSEGEKNSRRRSRFCRTGFSPMKGTGFSAGMDCRGR